MTLNTTSPYQVLDANGCQIFTGTHQECLKFELDQPNSIELYTCPISDEVIEDHDIINEDYNYNYED